MPPRYEEFSVTPTNMIAQVDHVFTHIQTKAKEFDVNFGHSHKLVDGEIKEFYRYDDSREMAHVMKAV